MNPLAWVRRRLTVRLTLTMLFVSLGPLTVAGFLVLRLIEDSLRRQIEAQHSQLAGVASLYVHDYVERTRFKLRYLATVIPQQEGEPQTAGPRRQDYERLTQKQMEQQLSRALEGNYEYAGLAYRNAAQSEVQNDAQVQQRALPQAQQSYVFEWTDKHVLRAQTQESPILSAAFAGREYSAPKILQGTDIAFLPLAIPLREGRDVFGILTATVTFDAVSETLRDLARDGRTLRLVDGEGNVLLETGPLPEGELIQSMQPVGTADWHFVVAQPRELAFAPLAHARMQALAWIGGSGLLAFSLSLLLASRILRPIRSLTAAADAMKEGALATRSGIAREDEIGRLAQSFDRMAAALQELDQMKSEFVAHVSHELRTPLTAMHLSVANLQEGLAGPLDERQREVLLRVRKDIDRLIRMVNEVLDIAKIEAGKLELARGPVDLADVVREVVRNLEPLAREKGVEVSVDAAPGPLTGDRAKLHQVATNLVDNAIKFTPAGGRVTIEVRPGLLRVADTGPGIPADRLPRIFDRFARAGALNAGAGLGLSITKKIVELHGGTISVESAEGRGTTLTVRL